LNDWQNLLQNGSEPIFRQRLKEVRTLMDAVNNGGWAISNKYQHYNAEVGPVLGGMVFAEKFFGASNNFDMAGENLPPAITQKTLTFLLPMRDSYEQGVGGLRQWMSDTSSRARETTERFRRVAQKGD
jgi:hypothetical protein